MLSGLKTKAPHSRSELKRVTKDDRPKDELFQEGARVTMDTLTNKFVNMNLEARTRKKVRLAFVFFFFFASRIFYGTGPQEKHLSILFPNCHRSRVVRSFPLG